MLLTLYFFLNHTQSVGKSALIWTEVLKIKQNFSPIKPSWKGLKKRKDTKSVISMEVFFARCSHLTEAIFEQLDAVNLAKCREVSWDWQEYLVDKRFLHIRVIRSLIGNVGQPWERFFKASNTDNIKQLRNAVERLGDSKIVCKWLTWLEMWWT